MSQRFRLPPTRLALFFTTAVASLSLAGCGGGGGGVSVPRPPPPTSPAPTPTPAPPTFNTSEVRRSDGPEFHKAITVWQAGITGDNESIAIIDTGIDSDSPEFAGRISSASRSVAGNGTFEAEDDHGTNVALVAAAALDDTGVVGIAYKADIIALRADEPNSCNTESDDVLDGCQFFDSAIARGVDAAIAAGASVINLSLGGSAPTSTLRQAIARAAQAGIVIVVAAGNDGDSTDADIDPNNPDPFAQGLLAAGGGNVIIVGSVGEGRQISDFSNRAGSFGESFLTARGERVCCVYENGKLLVETVNGENFVTVFSGTSFAAPQVSGAVALLAQAFPNLSGAEIVELLLDTADDAGATGVDSIYGRGILNIGRAFSPQGATSLAGTRQAVALAGDLAIASPAMGDALANTTAQALITDKYDRPYAVPLAARQQSAQPRRALANALGEGYRNLAGTAGTGLSMAVTIEDKRTAKAGADYRQLRLTDAEAEQARVLAGMVATRLGDRTKVAFGVAQSGQGLAAMLADRERPAFLIAPDSSRQTGFAMLSETSVAVRHDFGPWNVSAFADSGQAMLGTYRRVGSVSNEMAERYPISAVGISVGRDFGDLSPRLGLVSINEERTILGSYLHDAFGAEGARTVFVDAGISWAPDDWRLSADWRQGRTAARTTGLVANGSSFSSQAWTFDLARRNVFGANDWLAFRVTQPLRVSGGGLTLDLPTAFDFATEKATFTDELVSLSPSGREIAAELGWTGNLFDGSTHIGAFYRHEPNHIAEAPADVGGAVTWTRSF